MKSEKDVEPFGSVTNNNLEWMSSNPLALDHSSNRPFYFCFDNLMSGIDREITQPNLRKGCHAEKSVFLAQIAFDMVFHVLGGNSLQTAHYGERFISV